MQNRNYLNENMNSDKISVGVVFFREHLEVIEHLNLLAAPNAFGVIAEIILVANNATPASVRAIEDHIEVIQTQNQLTTGPRIVLARQNTSNIAKARQKIIELADSSWIYFTDPDCSPNLETISLLCANRNEKYFALAGPNIVPKVDSAIYPGLDLLFKTWFGNFASAQVKKWDQPRLINHAPTCNILYNKKKVIFEFDPNFASTGEDLDFNWAHAKVYPKSILFLPQAIVIHRHPTHLQGWFSKVCKWGVAQPQVFLKHLRIGLFYRVTPIVASIAAITILLMNLKLFLFFSVIYFLVTTAHSVIVISLWSNFANFRIHLLLTWLTHVAYVTGQWLSVYYMLRRTFQDFCFSKTRPMQDQ